MDIPDTLEIVEGRTRLLVPEKSVTEETPPKRPAFFNPKARLTRDFSVIAYAAFLKNFDGPKIFLEGLAGTGARGLRVANELKVEDVVINDLNPSALEMGRRSAELNDLKGIEFSEEEACRFFGSRSRRGRRGAVVDIDPFGSPAAFFDCGIRATMHGGILSATATDLQVLNGLFQGACRRRYGGVPARVEYGNEVAIRLILGCLRAVAARLEVKIAPLFVESNMHYYRTYVRVQTRPDPEENTGYILHCNGCGHRRITLEQMHECELCGSRTEIAGPLWIGKIFEKGFVEDMLQEAPGLETGRGCQKMLCKCLEESEMPGTYFTLGEVAARTKSPPPRLQNLVSDLQEKGFAASVTSLNPTGFRTSAGIDKIKKIFC